jgi:hypothetical protein
MSAIYEIKATNSSNKLQVDEAGTQRGAAIVSGLKNFVQFPWDDGVLLLGQAADGSVQTYKLTMTAPYVTPVASKFDLNGPCDILKAFIIGGQQHVLAYRAQTGKLSFHHVNADLTLSKPYGYSRLRSPGLTTGWTMLQPLTYLGMVYYVTYSMDTGAVELFNVNVTANVQDGIPPLQTLNVWSWEWAHGWTNFAFFQFGGENFFFKINVATPNVNIDHLCIDPNLRSNEVCTQKGKEMPDHQDPSLMVRSLAMQNSAPYLLTYLPGAGNTTFFSVNPDCQGWTNVAQLKTIAGANDIIPYRIGDRCFALFY